MPTFELIEENSPSCPVTGTVTAGTVLGVPMWVIAAAGIAAVVGIVVLGKHDALSTMQPESQSVVAPESQSVVAPAGLPDQSFGVRLDKYPMFALPAEVYKKTRASVHKNKRVSTHKRKGTGRVR